MLTWTAGTASPDELQLATLANASSGSQRPMSAKSAPKSRPVSSATAANTTLGGSARATNVATRRRAACSAAIRWVFCSAWRRFSASSSASRVRRARFASPATTNEVSPESTKASRTPGLLIPRLWTGAV
jgi:hypothetical protein